MAKTGKRRFAALLSAMVSFTLVTGLVPVRALAAGSDDQTPTPLVPAVDAIDMYRLYNPYSGEHLYTDDLVEVAALLEAGWHDEDIAWMAPSTSDVPVHRLYNPYSGEHLYTDDAGERDALLPLGWEDEGTGFYSFETNDAGERQSVYRLHNPYGDGATSHLFTSNAAERDALEKLGWVPEGGENGAAFFGMVSDPVDDHVIDLQDNVKLVDVEDWGDEAVEPMAADAGGSDADDFDAGVSGTETQFTVSTEEAVGIKVGDVIVGEPDAENEIGAAMVVSAIEPVADGYLVTGTVPELDQLIEYVDVSGTAVESDADVDYEPGVTPIETGEDGTMTLAIDPATLSIEGDSDVSALDGDRDFGSPLGRDYDFDLGRGVTLTFNPDLHYDFKYGFFSVRRAEITASLDTTLRLLDFSIDKSFSKRLFSFNFTVPNTFGAAVVSASFTLVANARGSATVVATSHLEQGFSYERGNFSWINRNTKPEIRASFEGSARGGMCPEVMLKLFGVNTAYLGIEGGLGADAVLEASNTGPDPLFCDVTIYLYADLSLNRESNAVGKLFTTLRIPTDVTLLDRNNSPIWNYHLPVV